MSGFFESRYSRPLECERGMFGVMQMHHRSSGTSYPSRSVLYVNGSW